MSHEVKKKEKDIKVSNASNSAMPRSGPQTGKNEIMKLEKDT